MRADTIVPWLTAVRAVIRVYNERHFTMFKIFPLLSTCVSQMRQSSTKICMLAFFLVYVRKYIRVSSA